MMHATTDVAATSVTIPLQGSGSLDRFKSFDVTPCIGTEFEDVDLSEWITGSDSDTLLRDLAILSKDILWLTPIYYYRSSLRGQS